MATETAFLQKEKLHFRKKRKKEKLQTWLLAVFYRIPTRKCILVHTIALSGWKVVLHLSI